MSEIPSDLEGLRQPIDDIDHKLQDLLIERLEIVANGTAPHITARLPFGARGNARPDGADALAIGRGTEQPTGQDRTFFATENAPDISRGRIVSTLSELGLSCTYIALCEHADSINTLIEVDGFVPVGDPRLDRF